MLWVRCLPGRPFNTLGFWKVRIQIRVNIYSYKLSTDTRAYISNHLSHRHGLPAYTSIHCPMWKDLFVQHRDRYQEAEQDKAGINRRPPNFQVCSEKKLS
jgi:hypothetical protein